MFRVMQIAGQALTALLVPELSSRIVSREHHECTAGLRESRRAGRLLPRRCLLKFDVLKVAASASRANFSRVYPWWSHACQITLVEAVEVLFGGPRGGGG
ncbi:hypothetical protein B0J14DRAFT_600382 [Halenospora varia]|nr:hypothetical protein B0J14DRAFT_600382 [Halenospora varia]